MTSSSSARAAARLKKACRWLAKLGLTIHPTTTRLCQAREEPFAFLGYTFGPARHWLTGKRFLSARLSKKAQKRLKEKINALFYRGNPTPWPELQARLNQLLKGWAGYFSFGYTGDADQAIRWHVAGRVRRFLCRRHKLPPGTGGGGEPRAGARLAARAQALVISRRSRSKNSSQHSRSRS